MVVNGRESTSGAQAGRVIQGVLVRYGCKSVERARVGHVERSARASFKLGRFDDGFLRGQSAADSFNPAGVERMPCEESLVPKRKNDLGDPATECQYGIV
jgi:hypothetical protein